MVCLLSLVVPESDRAGSVGGEGDEVLRRLEETLEKP
jgi:hypothetical protein